MQKHIATAPIPNENQDLNWTAAAMAEFVKSKTGRKLPLSAARELLALAHRSPSFNHLKAAHNKAIDVVPQANDAIETRILAFINCDQVTQEVAEGTVFLGTPEEWRLYSNEDTPATYYLGCDRELFESDVAPLLSEHDAKVFRFLIGKGFVEVRFDESATMVDELPMRSRLLDTENFQSSSLAKPSKSVREKKTSQASNLEEAIETLYGCHCDLEEGQAPDACVIDQGRPNDCVHAMHEEKAAGWKNKCVHWKPVTTTLGQAAKSGLYACKCGQDPNQGLTPTSCSIDTGDIKACKKAVALQKVKASRNVCEEWVPVSLTLRGK